MTVIVDWSLLVLPPPLAIGGRGGDAEVAVARADRDGAEPVEELVVELDLRQQLLRSSEEVPVGVAGAVELTVDVGQVRAETDLDREALR